MNFKLYLVFLLLVTPLVVIAAEGERKEEFKFKEVFKDEEACLKYLEKKQKLFIPENFHMLMGVQNADLVEKLKNGDPNARLTTYSRYYMNNGVSLLHCLMNGRNGSTKAIEALEYLFYKGANANITDGRGFTPLDLLTIAITCYGSMIASGFLTIDCKFYEKIKCLVRHGADYSTRKNDESFSNQEIIEALYGKLECDQCFKQWWPFRNANKYALCGELKNIRELFKEQQARR